ncbi:kyphoscoliosis peptidase-like [Centruroides sculpturatus]|uniref:kyphoscoliosis peptidase-like n=1 Tax=Centruroides sculpturatus TaxID=218467 RepID=UPI000C6EB69F|nr:kyphoscoliosis peptidase-like [Centruroides sculpturatus]
MSIKITQAPESVTSSIQSLVDYLTENAKNDLIKVRALFRWISNNIVYDWKYMETKMTAEEVFEKREGVCKDYSKLFNEMCKLANIRVKRLQGFAKGYDYRPGYKFQPGQDITHAWNAVYIFGAWRLIDTTWGTGYTDFTGKFQKKLNEHFFLPDPEVLIWTHFPYDEMESDYSRWQLLDKPLTLDEFNNLPKVTPYFFEFNLRFRSNLQNPITFRVQTEIKIGAQKPMRYKFKLYSAEDMENPSLNNYVFCQMKEERLVGSFAVFPPLEGRYVFKIYARPEWEMYDDATLRNVVIFLLDCVRSRRYIQPYPLNEIPWGPTQCFYDYGMKLLNQSVPIMVSWGNKRRLSIEMKEPMLVSHQIFDSNGCEIDTPGVLQKDETEKRIDFYFMPPRTGYYKLMIYALPKPKQKGKWKIPLVATFLFDCKQTRNGHDEDVPVPSSRPPDSKKKMKIQPMR